MLLDKISIVLSFLFIHHFWIFDEVSTLAMIFGHLQEVYGFVIIEYLGDSPDWDHRLRLPIIKLPI